MSAAGLRPVDLARLNIKLKRHPVLGKAKTWAWVAPGNVPDPIVLAVVSARLRGADLVLKLSRQNEKAGRALVRRHAGRKQKIRIVVDYADFKKYAASADAWVVYGSDETIARMRRLTPPSAGFVAHGHRISFSTVFKSGLGKNPQVFKKNLTRVARACARDVRAYDQRGCLSPQIVWVEGDAAEPLARALQTKLELLEKRSGPIRRAPEARHHRRVVLGELLVRALNPSDLVLIPASRSQRKSTALHPASEAPVVYLLKRGKFLTPASGQVIAVKSFKSVSDIRRGMKLFYSHVQGIAAEGSPAERARLRSAFRGSSAVYFSRIGQLQTPPLDWQL